jgi:hypothetical protein
LVGTHIAEYAKILQDENKDAYNSHFSRLIANDFDPTQYSSYVRKVKDAIISSNKLDKVAGKKS